MAGYSIPLTPGTSATMAVTTASSNIDLGFTVHQQVRLQNVGTTVLYFGFGSTSATVATVATSTPAANCHQLQPGAIEIFTRGSGDQYLAAIMGTGTANLYITTGHGS